MNKIKISVVIPTCHRNDLLAKCLDCLAPGEQTLSQRDYEVIVTDDGSSTTAEAMIRERYPWACWVSGPRKGPAANRNNGARYASGEWLAFTDDDCLPKPFWLEAYGSAIKPSTRVYEGRTVCETGIRSPLETAPLNSGGGYLWSCNMLIERELFNSLEGFDESFPAPCCEDVEFRERLKGKGHKFLFVPNAVVDHPPRKRLWGLRQGAMNESQVRLWYATGHRNSMGMRLFGRMLKFRLREIKQSPLSVASISWLLSTVIELLYISIKMSTWDRKHRAILDQHEKNRI
jgi:GT2 family glycosyltransferase